MIGRMFSRGGTVYPLTVCSRSQVSSIWRVNSDGSSAPAWAAIFDIRAPKLQGGRAAKAGGWQGSIVREGSSTTARSRIISSCSMSTGLWGPSTADRWRLGEAAASPIGISTRTPTTKRSVVCNEFQFVPECRFTSIPFALVILAKLS